jgi:peptide-methionine (S)-S-oxide reductase
MTRRAGHFAIFQRWDAKMHKIAMGGGCHWCTEAVFQSLRGVTQVSQGFVRATAPDDTWSEAVDLLFDPAQISLKDLIAVHLATHASTANHKMRGKYRSAIYVYDTHQAKAARAALDELARETDSRFVTRVLPHQGFKPSDTRFHNYYENDPSRPFCRTYIDPKLAKLRQRFSALLQQP